MSVILQNIDGPTDGFDRRLQFMGLFHYKVILVLRSLSNECCCLRHEA